MSAGRWAGALCTAALSAAALGWSASTPQGAVVAERVAAVGPFGWALAVAGLLCAYALRAARVFWEWRAHRQLAPADCLLVVLVHTAAVNLLPMRAGEIGYPVLLNRRLGIPLGEAATSLAWMRLQDVVTVAWLAALTLVAGSFGRGLLGPLAAGAAAAACTGAFLGCITRSGWLAERGFAALHRMAQAGSRHSRLRNALAHVFDAARSAALRQHRGTWLWCVAYWLAKLATLAVLLQALAAMPGFAAWCGALGGDSATALPLQPTAGFGTYEAGVALAATSAGAPQWREALGAALVVHVFMVGCSVLAAAAAWLASGAPATHAGRPARSAESRGST